MSRNKGAVGEREFAGVLRELGLHEAVRSFQEQCRSGGADLDGVPGWFVEVKRAERPSIGRWWTKAMRLAASASKRPALAWRRNREEWQILVALTPDEYVRFVKGATIEEPPS